VSCGKETLTALYQPEKRQPVSATRLLAPAIWVCDHKRDKHLHCPDWLRRT